MRRRACGLVLGLLALLSAPVRPEAAALERIAAAGNRLVLLATPAGWDRKAPLPLVVFLHGAARDAERALADFGWLAAADKAGFAVLAPQALPANPALPAKPPLFNPMRWNDGATPDTADDVAFVIAALDDALRRIPVAAGRVYLAGFAEGGAMAQRIAAAHAGRFAALASVAGHLRVTARPVEPLPVLLVFGGRDPQNPSTGGAIPSPFRTGASVPAIRDTAESWRAALGCDASPAVTLTPVIQQLRWAPCPGEASLTLLSIDDEGHGWPGQRAAVLPARLTGPVGASWDATSEIWSFFSPLRRTPR